MKKTLAKVSPAPKRWLSTEELMRYLDCSRDFIERIRESPIVVVCKVGAKYLYEINSIDRYILSQKI